MRRKAAHLSFLFYAIPRIKNKPTEISLQTIIIAEQNYHQNKVSNIILYFESKRFLLQRDLTYFPKRYPNFENMHR